MERMLAFEFFRWWYGQGWQLQFRNLEHRLTRTSSLFSAPSLLRTLFAPWRRIVSYPGAGIEAHVRAATDNFVSRLVGFAVRVMVLFAAAVILLLLLVIGLVELGVWPFLPLLIPALIIKGFLG
jgi:hypothetical protein